MSKAASSRQENDFYPTPDPLADAIAKEVAKVIGPVEFVIEPSAGTGAFIRAARKTWPDAAIAGVELDSSLEPTLRAAGADEVIINDWCDATSRDNFPLGTLLLGNPPFSQAEEHIVAGMKSLARGDHQAMLLRMSFLGSRRRLGFWEEFPARYLIPLVPRPNFMGNGKSDNSEYGVFVWQKGYQDTTEILPHLVWK